VIEEMKMYEDSPEDYAFDLLERKLYEDHAMGRPIIGMESSVRSFDRERLKRFMSDHYRPERMVITVAGNVKHDRLVRLVEQTFRQEPKIEPGFRRIPVHGYYPGTVGAEKPIQQAHLLLGTRIFGAQSADRISLSVLNTLLGGGMSSMLNQNIREKYGYCYNIYSFANLHSDSGEFGVYMGTDSSRLNRSKKLILRQLEKITLARVSPRKIQALRNQVKGSIMLGLESMDSRMMRLGRQEVYYRRYYSLDEILEQVEAVTAENIRDLAQQLFVPGQFSIVELLPERKKYTEISQ